MKSIGHLDLLGGTKTTPKDSSENHFPPQKFVDDRDILRKATRLEEALQVNRTVPVRSWI
jgi:hypothetical protein